ncbi:MAG: hypothetical protein QOF51_2687, partial [Chloroflexota bacterium]|jgi:uncharacterized membrane protein|nr:hypothetical protein [Chloroflexota bacterium]
VLALLIGVVAGLRAATAPAVVAWAAHLDLMNLASSPLSFMAFPVAVLVFTLLAIVELIGDKLPSAPSRTRPPGLIGRIVLGGLAGAAIAAAGSQSMIVGAGLGVAGAIAGAFAGRELRQRLVRALAVPDFVIACLEDAVAIGGGLLIVTRF